MDRFRDHAREMGARIEQAEVTGFGEESGMYVVRTRKGVPTARAASSLLPVASRAISAFPVRRVSGRGVSYCATCDAELFEGGRVVVIGSGETAVEEAATSADSPTRSS